MSALGRLWEPLGEWRTRALFRLYALCLFTFTLIKYAEAGSLLLRPEYEFHGLAASALLLLVAGPRIAALAFAWVWTLLAFGALLAGTDLLFFPAAEWTIFLIVPTFACAVSTIALYGQRRSNEGDAAAARYRAEVDWGIVAVFRVMCCVVLGFAALHKLNADFFDPDVSCIGLKDRLHAWWGLPPQAYAWFGPVHVVVGEGLAPVLLATVPAVGVAVTVLMVATFASIGAPAFAGLVVAMALSFLPHDARPVLMRGFRKCWPLLLCGALAVLAARLRYAGDFPWLPLAVAQCLALTALFCSGLLAVDRLRRRREGKAPAPSARALPRAPASQRALIGAMALA